MELDLSSFESIHKFSNELMSRERKIDFLICNAGIGWSSDHPKITSDGQVINVLYISGQIKSYKSMILDTKI